MVSLMCLCKKCTLSSALVADRPLHPSTETFRGTSALSEYIQYICESPAGGGEGYLPLIFPSRALVNAIMCFPVDLQKPFHQVRTKVRALNHSLLSVPVGDSLPCHMLH